MPPNTALTLVAANETIGQRISRLQSEARQGALQEAAEIAVSIDTLRLRAEDLSTSGDALPDGVKQLLVQFNAQAKASSDSLEALLHRIAKAQALAR